MPKGSNGDLHNLRNCRYCSLLEGKESAKEVIRAHNNLASSGHDHEFLLREQDAHDHEARALQYVHGRVHGDPRCVCVHECAREHVRGCGYVNVRGCVLCLRENVRVYGHGCARGNEDVCVRVFLP